MKERRAGQGRARLEPLDGDGPDAPLREKCRNREPDHATAEQLYDFIRMLDADGYPRAFVERGEWRMELSDASLAGKTLDARARIVPIEKERR